MLHSSWNHTGFPRHGTYWWCLPLSSHHLVMSNGNRTLDILPQGVGGTNRCPKMFFSCSLADLSPGWRTEAIRPYSTQGGCHLIATGRLLLQVLGGGANIATKTFGDFGRKYVQLWQTWSTWMFSTDSQLTVGGLDEFGVPHLATLVRE